MFGNLTGWLASAGIALLMGWLLYYVAVPPARTPPTNSASLAAAKNPISLPVAWDTAVSAGTKDCDAGDMYQKAIDDYLQSPNIYERFNGAPTKVKEDEMPAIADILNGRDCKNFNLFRKNPSKIINYENSHPAIEALDDAGRICCTLGLLYTKYEPHDPKRAVRLWESAFVLGAHLYDERMSWAELATGHKLMQSAASSLLAYYKDAKNQDQADKLQKFMDPENDYQMKLNAAFTIIGGMQEAPSEKYSGVGIYAGDIYQIAESKSVTADPMFRTEAIKHIGKYQYNVVNTGDQLAARKVLRVLAENPDVPPNVKAAAEAARTLTEEQYHLYNGG